ncbi:hypothetical protein BGP_0974 [Beggiatoa sp. PS]|nr:hypothetical protein BGP_0974 [Beggiatoa sp. PS]
MKIIIYQSDKTVPFSELYKPLGGFNKLFFSNKINQFDESHIKILLPNNLKQDDSTFLVPEPWKADFFGLLDNKFPDIKWQEAQTPTKLPKKEIGSGWSDDLSKLYEENVEILEIWTSKKTLKESKVWSLKVFVYTNELEVPFDEFYQALGSYKKIIFSNKKPFDEKTAQSLLEATNFEDDSTVFYVPLEMKENFVELLKKFLTIIKKWNIEITPLESLKEPMGIIWDKFSQFYEKMKVIEVFNMSRTKECPKECIDLLNDIVNQVKTIDAIFIYDVKNKYMLCKTENPSKPETLLKYNSLKSIMKSLDSLKNEGLKYEILKFDDGFVISYLVRNPSDSPVAIIGFITTVKEDRILNKFLFFCNNEFNALKEQVLLISQFENNE